MTLTPADFKAWDQAQDEPEKLKVLIEDALATAAIVAPCINEPDFTYTIAAKAILREAVLRRLDAGTGAVTTYQTSTGPYGETQTVDTRLRRTIFQPSDVQELERLCKLYRGDSGPRAGSVNLDPAGNQPVVVPPQFWDRPDLWLQHNGPWPAGGLDARTDLWQ